MSNNIPPSGEHIFGKSPEDQIEIPTLEHQQEVVRDYIQEVSNSSRLVSKITPTVYFQQAGSTSTMPKEREWKTVKGVVTPGRASKLRTSTAPKHLESERNKVLSVGLWSSPTHPTKAPTSSSSQVTPEQQLRMEINRKRAYELREKAKEREKKVSKMAFSTLGSCVRCGSTEPDTLCIVWFHSGKVEHITDAYKHRSYQLARCCGRRLPQPCFIGKHSFEAEANIQAHADQALRCQCNKLAIFHRTHKEGKNTGRYFFTCGSIGSDKCGFFKWADHVYGVGSTKGTPAMSHDGIKEWMFPQANPFSELDILQQGHMAKKQSCQRLLAALFIRLLIHIVCAVPDKKTKVKFDEVVSEVTKTLENEKKLLKGLWPMTPTQVENRLGSLSSLKDFDPTDKEIRAALHEALRRNHVLRSTVRYLQSHTDHDPDRTENTVLDLTGLDTYFTV